MRRLHLIDGTFELYRAHYAKRPDVARKATLGVVASLRALFKDPQESVTHVAVAFDNPIRSFRNDLFAGYKSDEGVPADLRMQFDDVERAVSELGVAVWSMDHYEADDAIASAVTRFGPEVDQVRILSPDKDFGQCLEGERVVLVDRIRKRVLSESDLYGRWGIRPKHVPDFLALVGDDADGIPGLPGFGEKTAAALLMHFGGLESIDPNVSSWPSGIRGGATLAEVWRARSSDAMLYRRLATLVRDVPLEVDHLDQLRRPATIAP